MKAKMLKIAGVKSEKEFYKKYPTEEAFMKVHGKAFKKAQIGAYIGGETDSGFKPTSFKDIYDEADYAITGSTQDIRKEEMRRNLEAAAAKKSIQGGNNTLGNIGNVLSQVGEEYAKSGSFAKKGKKIKKAKDGTSAFIDPATGLIESITGMISADDTANLDSNAMVNASSSSSSGSGKASGDWMTQIGKYAGPAGELLQGFQQLKEEKKALQRARQMQGVSDISLQASRTTPEQTQRRYVRPEDMVAMSEQLYPTYGTGTNVLAKNGAEITNTFAPNTLYDDLGYEPLNDSERYKQFMKGGKLYKAKDGFLSSLAGAGGGKMGSDLITAIGGENAGGNIGGTVGKTVGNLVLPGVGGMIGQVGGQLIGSLIDQRPRKTKKAQQATQRNIQNMALQQGLQGAQGQYTSFMKDGGEVGDEYKWVSHTWQPQVIAKFGEHDVKDLLKPPADADMLRAGGHLKAYTPPSARAMSTERPMMQMGGELQTHWGGYAEPISYNPYMPGTGETVMFKGYTPEEGSHEQVSKTVNNGETGIGMTYGGNLVEVEKGEPMFEMEEGGEIDPITGEPKKSGLVLGNIKITNALANLLGDPKAKNKSFKKYGADLSNEENKQGKLIEKSLAKLDEIDVDNAFTRLAFNGLQMNMLGANMNYKDLAQKKMDAAALQTAVNDNKEAGTLNITDKGDIVAKKGAKILQAQDGKSLPKLPLEDYNYLRGLYDKAEKQGKGSDVLKFQQEYHRLAAPYAKDVLSKEPVTRYGKGKRPPLSNIDLTSNEDSIFGKRTRQYLSALETAGPKIETISNRTRPEMQLPTELKIPKYVKDMKVSETTEKTPNKKDNTDLINYFNQVLPYLRPSDVEELDPNQLMGEMFALFQNQLKPVQAQLFQPELGTPYDISLQDILNENEASFRAQQRVAGYNPAFQSQLAAQKYAANQKVLGEQFRMNQAMKDQVYKENRNLLNQAKLQNLGILDQQYQRKDQAKDVTKATAQEALNSIASKYAQNKLENRTLQVYENMYNYRFDPKFRAMNMNPLVDFQSMLENASPEQLNEYTKAIQEKTKSSKGDKSKTSRNGSIVKALKNI